MNRYNLSLPKPIKLPPPTDEEIIEYINSLPQTERTEALDVIAHWSYNDDRKKFLMRDHRPDPQTIVNDNPPSKNIFKRIKIFFIIKKISINKRLRNFFLPRFERWLSSKGYYGKWRKKPAFKSFDIYSKEAPVRTMAPRDAMTPGVDVATIVDRNIKSFETLDEIEDADIDMGKKSL